MPESKLRLNDEDVAMFWRGVQERIGRQSTIDLEGKDTILKMWRSRVLLSSHKFAFECLGRKLTFEEIDLYSDALAHHFIQHSSLSRGDRVAIMLPNLTQYLISVLAILKAGMTVVNCNPLYTTSEIQHQLNDAEAKILITMPNVAKASAEAQIPSLKEVVLTTLGDLLPPAKKYLLNFMVRYVKRMIPAYTYSPEIVVRSFTELLKPIGESERKQLRASEMKVKPTDIAFIQYTGGTTGLSKGAVITQLNMVYNMLQSRASFSREVVEKATELLKVPGSTNAICLHPLPFYHIYGLICCLLTAAASGAATITTPNPRDLKNLCKLMSRPGLMMFTSINTLLKALLMSSYLDKVKLPSNFVVVAGGMATSPDVNKEWLARTGTRISEGYGLTEASPMLCLADPYDPAAGVAGYALPETLIKLRDEEGNDLPLGVGLDARGEILAKGPQLMRGYYKNPQETEQIFTEDGYLRTGDVGTIREDGLVEIVDRQKDMINVSGFSVYPSEIEARALETDLLIECAVIGVPDSKTGEKVVLYAVSRDKNLSKEVLFEALKTRLTNYKRPHEIVFVEALPKTAVGKILRRKVRESAMSSSAELDKKL